MRPEGWFKRLLRKLGIINEPEFDEQKRNEFKSEMCSRSIHSGVCPQACEICDRTVKNE